MVSVLCTNWVCGRGELKMHCVMFFRGEVINGGFGLLLDGSEVSVAFDGVYLPMCTAFPGCSRSSKDDVVLGRSEWSECDHLYSNISSMESASHPSCIYIDCSTQLVRSPTG